MAQALDDATCSVVHRRRRLQETRIEVANPRLQPSQDERQMSMLCDSDIIGLYRCYTTSHCA
jgi:hypothetical protein